MNDKLMHFIVGVVVATFAAGLWYAMAQFGLVAMVDGWAAAGLASLVAGVTKEGADKLDNKIRPGMHGVEVLDALATAAGALPVMALLAVVV